jgi:hypothetical protein
MKLIHDIMHKDITFCNNVNHAIYHIKWQLIYTWLTDWFVFNIKWAVRQLYSSREDVYLFDLSAVLRMTHRNKINGCKPRRKYSQWHVITDRNIHYNSMQWLSLIINKPFRISSNLFHARQIFLFAILLVSMMCIISVFETLNILL